MKIGSLKLSVASLMLLFFQVLLVSAVAGKYFYQRWTCPRGWTRAAASDAQLAMRGRYLSVQLSVDGCRSTLPSAKQASFPRTFEGTVQAPHFSITGPGQVEFPARLTIQNNRLAAIELPQGEPPALGQQVIATPGEPCEQMHLSAPVNFYIPEHARSPVPLAAGSELWIEVTVPPQGAPRAIQLALKQNGAWTPLAFQ